MNSLQIKCDALESALSMLDQCQVECDGMTALISYVLQREGIEHFRMVGAAIHQRTHETVFPHCWVELPEIGKVIDFRLRMWLGDTDEIPHGVFSKVNDVIEYRGDVHATAPLPKGIAQIISDGIVDSIVFFGNEYGLKEGAKLSPG